MKTYQVSEALLNQVIKLLNAYLNDSVGMLILNSFQTQYSEKEINKCIEKIKELKNENIQD